MSAARKCKSYFTRHCEAATKIPVAGEVVGSIPEWLNGRLVRNGPGGKRVGEHEFKHLFDGFACLHMINISKGKATYTSRFLEGNTYKNNTAAQRLVVSEFGTAAVPDPCQSVFGRMMAQFQPKSMDRNMDNCSVNVMQVKDELLAMTETNIVRVVDLETLETKGKYAYSEHCAVFRATAHPHVAPDGIAYNLAMALDKGQPLYTLVALPEGDITKAKIVGSAPARWKFNPSYMHSFGITENFFILEESALALNVLKVMAPPILVPTVADSFAFHENEKTMFRIISRATGKEVATTYSTDAFFGFHFSNCYEADGCIVIDIVANNGSIIDELRTDNLNLDAGDPLHKPSNGTLQRYVLPIDGIETAEIGPNLLTEKADACISGGNFRSDATAVKNDKGNVELVPAIFADLTMELPRINYAYNMKPYTYSYGVLFEETSNIDPYAIVKVNMKTGEKDIWQDDDYFTSEPVFVAGPGAEEEDDGLILSLLLHREEPSRCALVVLNAANLAELGRASFRAEGTVAATFHGQFIAAADTQHAY